MTELRIVRGSWPMEAVEVACQKSWAEGCRMGIEGGGCVSFDGVGPRAERTRPIVKTIKAYGSFGYANVDSKSRTAKRAQSRLSPHHGPVQESGLSIVVPALRQRDRPAPTWMPFTTGMGVTRFAQFMSPVMLNNPTKAATTSPAAAFSSSVNFRAMATAAIAFMGCTGNGIPNAMPVSMLAAPVKSKVEGSDIEFVMTRAVISGSRVPRSPSEPENSARGCSLSV